MHGEDVTASGNATGSPAAPPPADECCDQAKGPVEAILGSSAATSLEAAPASPSPGAPLGRHWTVGLMLRDLVETVLLALLVFAGLRVAVQNTVVQGDSMLPNFTDGQRLLVNRLAFRWRSPERGDVIVFHAPDGHRRDFIKRVVALPGEWVEIRDGTLYIDGRPIAEPWQPIPDHTAFPAYQVPPGHVFVLGDNRPNSNDSRTWGGGLPISGIVGEAWLSIWPPERWGLVPKATKGTATASDGS